MKDQIMEKNGHVDFMFYFICELTICLNLIFFSLFKGVSTAFVGNFWTFSLCRFLVGFAFDNCFTMMYILGKLKTVGLGQVSTFVRLLTI